MTTTQQYKTHYETQTEINLDVLQKRPFLFLCMILRLAFQRKSIHNFNLI